MHKCGTYRSYWQSGTEQAWHEVFPRMLQLVPDEPRVRLMAGVIAGRPADARSLFGVSLRPTPSSGWVRGRVMSELPRNIMLAGDAAAVLAGLPAASVDCVITSPPYQPRDDASLGSSGWRRPSPAGWRTCVP